MKYPRRVKVFYGQLDAAPLVGVLFLLIIFLLLHSSLVFTPGVRIQLPATDGPPLPGLSGPSAVVAMDLSGQLFFENQVVQEKELRARLKAAVEKAPDLTLVIQADQAVKLEAFYRLSELASDVGVRQVLIAGHRPSIHERQSINASIHQPDNRAPPKTRYSVTTPGPSP